MTPTTDRHPEPAPNHRCVIEAVAQELASAPCVKAVSLIPSEGQVAVATLGCDTDPNAAGRIAASINRLQEQPPHAACQLLKPDPQCSDCEVSATLGRRAGLTVTQDGGTTTIARITCPTAPLLCCWRRFPLPKIAPRRLSLPENDAELNEWIPQAMAAALCGALGLGATLIHDPTWSLPLYFLAYLAGAWFAAHEVWERLQSRILDVHFLMLTVAAGSAAIGAYGEGAMLLFLFSTSSALEHYAMGRTQREIRSLFRSAPKVATLIDEHAHEHEVPVESLQIGELLRIKAGAQFPVDAEIVRGRTACDESNLTGEATPIEKQIGDSVLAGTLNLWGVVETRVLRPVQESALANIIRLIREAQHLKAPSQRFTDRFGSGYTYCILGLSLAMFFVWWLGAGLAPFASNPDSKSAFYRTMTLLVVASPCALVLSIPSAILAAIAWGARRGILFRGGGAVERLSRIDTVALDKTGTLTTGELQVDRIESFPPGRETEVARIAFSLERLSTHPLARAITRYGKQSGLQPIEFDQSESITGAGIQAQLGDQQFRLGRREWLESCLPQEHAFNHLPTEPDNLPAYSEVWIHHQNLLGRILLQDSLRPQARPVVEALQNLGLRTVVLTGDRPAPARALQLSLGLDDVRSQLNPQQKVDAIREFIRSGHSVAMIGDGVNDAPSLTAAQVGVAMGARGSDTALEQAEIVLMHDRLENFLAAYRLSRRARTIIRQNLVISLGTVVVLVTFAVLGAIPLTLGVLGHEGSTVIVVLNSLRLLFAPNETSSPT